MLCAPGHRITLAGKGNEAPGRGAGDLVLVVRQALHARFERRGDDLLATAQVRCRLHSEEGQRGCDISSAPSSLALHQESL